MASDDKGAPVLTWQILKNVGNTRTLQHFGLSVRAKVPGGWLVVISGGGNAGLTFVPDPDHKWDDVRFGKQSGVSLP